MNAIAAKKKILSATLTTWDRRLLAWHEAGHVVVSHFSPEQERVCCVSIDPSAKAFGMMKTRKTKRHNMTRRFLLGNISVALAGRLAEEHFLHTLSSSCIDDLNKAREIAIQMVASFGMGARSGLLRCFNPVDNVLLILSNQQRENLFLDVRDLIDEAKENALKILKTHASQVENIASLIFKRVTLGGDDVKGFP